MTKRAELRAGRGTVRWWSEATFEGAIKRDDGAPDLLFHSALSFVEGEAVRFKAAPSGKLAYAVERVRAQREVPLW